MGSPQVLVHGNRMGVLVAMGNSGLEILTCVHFGHDNLDLDLRDKEDTEIQSLDAGVQVVVGHSGQNLEGTYEEAVVENLLAFHLVGQRNDQEARMGVAGMAFPWDVGNLFR